MDLPVRDLNKDIKCFIDDISEVMYMDDGIGLAAPQIGVSKQIIVLDSGEGLQSYINPQIIHKGNILESVEEGCLSLPEIRLDITRPTEVIVQALNENGEQVKVEADGLLARVFQHEIDHLQGILLIDYASSIQRTLLRPKLKRLEKQV